MDCDTGILERGQLIRASEKAWVSDVETHYEDGNMLWLRCNLGWVCPEELVLGEGLLLKPFDVRIQSVVFKETLNKILMFWYFPITLWSMRSFYCLDVDGYGKYLAADTAVVCWSSDSGHRLIAAVSASMFLLYGLCFPVVLLARLRQENMKRLGYVKQNNDNEASTPLLNELNFVWSREQTNESPLAFLFSFLQPRGEYARSYVHVRL